MLILSWSAMDGRPETIGAVSYCADKKIRKVPSIPAQWQSSRDLRSRPSVPHTWKIGPSARFQGRGNVCDDRRFIIDELLRLPLQLADVLSTSIIHVWRCDVDSRLKPPVRSRADDRVEFIVHGFRNAVHHHGDDLSCPA